MKIPYDTLSPEALLGVIDAFVLREGTDYGHSDYTLEQKRDRVMAQLRRGRAEIHYHPENDHIEIVVTQS